MGRGCLTPAPATPASVWVSFGTSTQTLLLNSMLAMKPFRSYSFPKNLPCRSTGADISQSLNRSGSAVISQHPIVPVL
jgi:hypothetical protein